MCLVVALRDWAIGMNHSQRQMARSGPTADNADDLRPCCTTVLVIVL